MANKFLYYKNPNERENDSLYFRFNLEKESLLKETQSQSVFEINYQNLLSALKIKSIQIYIRGCIRVNKRKKRVIKKKEMMKREKRLLRN